MAQTQVASLSCINTPINRLPEHVLSSIFVTVYFGWRINREWNGIQQTRVPYILASVSRHWRTIALSTSRLWDFVDLSLRSEHLATHLARSKNQPIDVELFLGKDSNVDIQESLRILGERHNWTRVEHLDIGLGSERPRVSGPVVDAVNTAINANPVGIFQTISIHVDRSVDTGPGELRLRIPQSQALRRVSLHEVGLSPMLIPSSSPLLELEHVELESVDIGLPDSLFPLLDLAPNLTSLSLGGSRLRTRPGSTTSTPRSGHSISLPKLNDLTLHSTRGVAGLNVMFQTLNMPNLRFLSFTALVNRQWAGIDWNAICHCHRLRYLRLAGLTSEALMGLLSHIDMLAQLQALILSPGRPAPDEFARQLARRLLDTSHCPGLLDLSMYFPLDNGSMGIIEELRSARPSLTVYVESDEWDYEEDDIEDENGILEAENAGDQAENDTN
ncbi:hypothetical protein FS749_015524 [Ceratobasidium sp. UAMH 11750]|nr:hypothetical protein FS749_015524 [Ceratobasidium sp. UAMH 11750]